MSRWPKNPFADEKGPIIFAHRGWRACYPENTMLAFHKAAELDIDALEIDVQATRDGVLVVTHDTTVERTTNGQGRVYHFTLNELQELDAGYHWTNDEGQTFPFRGQNLTIPTLEEVYETFPNLWINIDIKQHETHVAEKLAALIKRLNVVERSCVGSFDVTTIRIFRQLAHSVVKSGSRAEIKRMVILNWVYLDGLYRGQADIFQVPEYDKGRHIVTKQFIKSCHRNHVAVHVWTINEISDMRRLIDLGVDGLITDYPDRALELLGRT